LTLSDDSQKLTDRQQACVPGDYMRYYEGIRDAVQLGQPNPVPPEAALQVMELMELGFISAKEGRRVSVNPTQDSQV
jgi:predicted dehydrogenase